MRNRYVICSVCIVIFLMLSISSWCSLNPFIEEVGATDVLPDLVINGTIQSLGGSLNYSNVVIENLGVLQINETGWLQLNVLHDFNISAGCLVEGASRGSNLGGTGGYCPSGSMVAYGTDGQGTGYGRVNFGGAGGGGGGAAYGGSGGRGGDDNDNSQTNTYGTVGNSTIEVGSGGGGGGCRTYGTVGSGNVAGGGGGRSGASIEIRAENINMFGTINVTGGRGEDGWAQYWYTRGEGSGGGGGSGGGILLVGHKINATGGYLSSKGGDGGNGGGSQGFTGNAGGGGGGGRIKIFYSYAFRNSSMNYDITGGVCGTPENGATNGTSGSYYAVQLGNNLIIDDATVTLWGDLYFDSIIIRNGGTLVVDSHNGTNRGWISLTATTLEIDSSSRILATGTGFRGGANVQGDDSQILGFGLEGGLGGGPGNGYSGQIVGSAGTDDGFAYAAGSGGGGYGNEGGDGGICQPFSHGGLGGVSYGNESDLDIIPGSGGAGGSAVAFGMDSRFEYNFNIRTGQGGSGGGAVRLNVDNMSIQGEINADGADGEWPYHSASGYCNTASGGSGGGSGGTVLLIGKTIGLSSCTITADGGTGGGAVSYGYHTAQAGGGGGGSGGRIKIFCESMTNESCLVEATAGLGGIGSEGQAGQDGLAGSVVVSTGKGIVVKGENALIRSNVTIMDCKVGQSSVHFNASGPAGSIGWINITFPMINATSIKVFFDNHKLTPPPFPIITANGTHYFIYVEFSCSEHDMTFRFMHDGDINGDNQVDIFDAVILANAFGSNPENTNWNIDANINGDGIIDIFDAVLLANNFGQHFP